MSTQSIEDEEPVDYQEPEVSETVSEPEPTAPVQHSLPQGDDTKGPEDLHAGFHVHPRINENSGKINDNSNRIDQLEKLMKPSKPEPVPTSSEFNVIAYGGGSYAEY